MFILLSTIIPSQSVPVPIPGKWRGPHQEGHPAQKHRQATHANHPAVATGDPRMAISRKLSLLYKMQSNYNRDHKNTTKTKQIINFRIQSMENE